MSDFAARNTIRARLLNDLLVTSEQGLWQIYGEDPNCDFGGSHHQPLLAMVEGTYAAAVDYAVDLPNFVTWGGGGKIVKVVVVKLDRASNEARRALKQQRQDLKAKLDDLETQLKQLG